MVKEFTILCFSYCYIWCYYATKIPEDSYIFKVYISNNLVLCQFSLIHFDIYYDSKFIKKSGVLSTNIWPQPLFKYKNNVYLREHSLIMELWGWQKWEGGQSCLGRWNNFRFGSLLGGHMSPWATCWPRYIFQKIHSVSFISMQFGFFLDPYLGITERRTQKFIYWPRILHLDIT